MRRKEHLGEIFHKEIQYAHEEGGTLLQQWFIFVSLRFIEEKEAELIMNKYNPTYSKNSCGLFIRVSDLGEAQRGYIFSQLFSLGCSFSCLFVIYFLFHFSFGCMAAWLLWGCLFTEQSSWDNQGSQLREQRGGLTASHHLLFWRVFFQTVSIKGRSVPTGYREESWTQSLKSGLHCVWGVVAHWAVGCKKLFFFFLVWLLLDVSWE